VNGGNKKLEKEKHPNNNNKTVEEVTCELVILIAKLRILLIQVERFKRKKSHFSVLFVCLFFGQ